MRSSHSLGSAPHAMPVPRSKVNAAMTATLPRECATGPWTASLRIGGSCDALDFGAIEGLRFDDGVRADEPEQRHAARERTRVFAVRHDVVREARRRREIR